MSVADVFSHIQPLSPLPTEIFDCVDKTMESNHEENITEHVDDTTQREITDDTSNTNSEETGSDAHRNTEVDTSRDNISIDIIFLQKTVR